MASSLVAKSRASFLLMVHSSAPLQYLPDLKHFSRIFITSLFVCLTFLHVKQTKSEVMKILLKCLRSGKYCKGADEWTINKNDALDFATSDDAIRFAQRHHLNEVQVIAQ